MSNNGKRKEKDFQTEIKQSLDHYNRVNNTDFEYRKFTDMDFHTKGYDCEILGKNKFLLCLELKITKSVNTINFHTLFRDREHELETLEKREKQGFNAFILVNHYNKTLRINKAYRFSPYSIRCIIRQEKGVRKCNHHFNPEIPRVKDDLMSRYVWDLSSFLQNN